MLSAETITLDEFNTTLSRYPALIQSISTSKNDKGLANAFSLEELDQIRFEDMPNRYYKKEDLENTNSIPTPLTRADVLQLVRWKLKHGTFRPNLMKLAESNMEDDVKAVTQEAFKIYKHDNFEVTKAIGKLATLKGIGPATASLLLSVHDPARVVFFGDEVFQWICYDGKKATIKYNMKEYEDLISKARKLIVRLGVNARDVEKVGFVLMKESIGPITKTNGTGPVTKKVRGKDTETAVEDKRAEETGAELIKRRKRGSKPIEKKVPTEMTAERKAQLVAVAAKGRAARIARKEAREAKGQKFRERVDAARERKKDEVGSGSPVVEAGAKRKSDVTTRGSAMSAKRARRSME